MKKKAQIIKITEDLENGNLSLAEAQNLLFDLSDACDNDTLILLERNFPKIYEIHRKEIRRAENLVLTTTDKEFAERLVNAYNHYR